MRVESLDTPCAVVDLDVLERNLRRAQAHADASGLRLRPHVKTHKLPEIARMQVGLGAAGITCQKLGEAEAMAEGGLGDILLTYNILGEAKLGRLRRLRGRAAVAVVADGPEVVAGYAAAFGPADPLRVLVECDTGAGRCGVQSPAEALGLARTIAAAPGLRFGGLMTYPPRARRAAAEAWLAEAARLLSEAGLPPATVSSGGTPDLWGGGAGVVTEYRPGTYAYMDRMQVAWDAATLADCALTVHATVVSRPTPTRAVLDAGSKALAADLAPLPGHGTILEHPEAVVASLSEEHAVVDLAACPSRRPRVGDRVRVVPNHACVVTNLFDTVHLARGGEARPAAVTSRGRMG